MWQILVDATADLVWGGQCVGCERPGRALCLSCRELLPASARRVWPRPPPPGLAPTFACGDYDDLVRELILSHKERGVWSLAHPLGDLLAQAVMAGFDRRLAEVSPTSAGGRSILLVPVPSRPHAVRSRGYDPTWAMVGSAAATLRRAGIATAAARLLRHRRLPADQAGLTAEQRRENLWESMWCPSAALTGAVRRHRRAWIVLCDDVVTTGWTAREAQRALACVGAAVHHVAAPAATRRRRAPTRAVWQMGQTLSREPGSD